MHAAAQFPFSSGTVQYPSQGMEPPIVDESSHLSLCNQANPPQAYSEAHLLSPSKFCQTGN